MQPGLFSLSIIRAELPDKAAFAAVDGGGPIACSDFVEGRGRQVCVGGQNSLYDSFTNPVNITAVAVCLLIMCRP
jgi:hypothetical protein